MTPTSSQAQAPAVSPAGAASWTRLAPILVVHFCGTLGFSIALPFLVFLVTDFGGAPWTYGLVGATYSAAQLVGAPILGRWSDRTGRRPVLLLSQGGTLLAWLIFLGALQLERHVLGEVAGATVTVPLLLVFLARLLDGLTGGNISVANAYVADLTRDDKEARSVAFGRMGMATSLGFTLGPALAGLLGGLGDGYSAPVMAAALVSAVGVALCATLKEPGGRCPEGPPQQRTLNRVLGQQQRRCDRQPTRLDRSVLRQPTVLLLLSATFVLFLGFNLYYASWPIHTTQSIGWSSVELGAFFSLMSIAMVVMQGPVLQWATKRFAPRTVFGVGLTGLVVAFLCFPIEMSFAAYAGGLLFAFGNGLAWATFQARTSNAVPDSEQGIVQGASASAGALASIVGLILGGMLYPVFGKGVFLLCTAHFVLVLFATPLLFPRASTRSPQDA